jgi:hypothetical protein
VDPEGFILDFTGVVVGDLDPTFHFDTCPDPNPSYTSLKI